MIRTRTIALVLAMIGLPQSARGSDPASLAFFESKVRPLLVARCYECHSAEHRKSKGGLLLDTREGWIKGGDSGPALVPGDPDKSLLIQAVRHEKQDLEMPPKGKLADAEVETFVRWVRMGAPDPRGAGVATGPRSIDPGAARQHWAYQPSRAPAVPTVRDTRWPVNDVDRFILARLEGANLRPAPDADPVTLVRRVYFDLVGLPPTPEEVDAYLNDPVPADRYERLVDRLLASPQYGERWGRHWLDVARYAESLTLRGFVLKDAWRYRDYVIDSFNTDRPFDQFIRQQVAGDLMPANSDEDRRRGVVATAFLALGNHNLEEQDKKQLEMDVVDEQLDTIGRAFLAQTIGCARCHDHKFDPIPARDYYALAGILKSTQTLEHANVSKWLEAPLPVDPAREAALKAHEAAVADLQGKVKAAKAALADAGIKPPSPSTPTPLSSLLGIVVDDSKAKRVGTWKESSAVGPFIGHGYLTDNRAKGGPLTLTFQPDVPESGRYEVRLAYTAGAARATNVQVTVFGADGEKTLTVNQREAPPVDRHFVSLGQHTFEKTGQGFVIVSNENADGYVVADAVQFIPVDSPALKNAAAPPPSPGAQPGVTTLAERLKQLESELKQLLDSGPRRDAVISVRESSQPADTRVHVRGSVHTLGEPAPRGFLRVVPVSAPPAVPKDQSGRLQLGQWLAHPENPLPARVMANRAWHWLTGSGLVRTVDNFGTTGEPPSHPELLDHLASRFAAEEWSVKRLVRRIVLSRTYRMATVESQTARATDPENRLLSRMNRRRLEAECIRDGILSVSGRLNHDGGGPAYKHTLTSDFGYRHTDTRRSVYAPVFRNALPEILEAFDFADPSVSTGRRNASTVAPQALFMLNHPFIKEQSGHAATRLLSLKLPDDRARVIAAYRQVLGRAPTQSEIAAALQFLTSSATENSVDDWTQIYHALFASMDFRYVD